jgi:hypothetical protein
MARCAAIKPNGEPCRGIAATGSDWCPAHDPARRDARKRAASKAARSSRGEGGAIALIKRQLEDLAAGVTGGEVDRADAAVVNQILNTQLRALELERRGAQNAYSAEDLHRDMLLLSNILRTHLDRPTFLKINDELRHIVERAG